MNRKRAGYPSRRCHFACEWLHGMVSYALLFPSFIALTELPYGGSFVMFLSGVYLGWAWSRIWLALGIPYSTLDEHWRVR